MHEINAETEINLTNIRESPIISLEDTNKKIDTIKRADKRQEVERHFADNDFKQVAELLWVTLKANPTAEESQPLPQERANQLSLLLESLQKLSRSSSEFIQESKVCFLPDRV